MALFSIPQLKAAANLPVSLSQGARQKSASAVLRESVEKFSEDRTFDIFFSHRFLEADAALGLKNILGSYGYDVYVDWIVDAHVDRTKATRHNAHLLRRRMQNSRCLIVATTMEFRESVWIPWEVGYMDGMGGRVATAPATATKVTSDSFTGSEYFALYPYLIEQTLSNSTKKTLWICQSSDVYIRFDRWLAGEEPYKH